MPTDTRLHRRAADLFADALDRDPAEREALLAALDPDLVGEVRSLLAAHDAAGDDALAPLALAPPGPEALLGQTVGPWRLDGVLGTGGMGVVYEARRVAGGFAQRAALKRVRPGVGTDFHARFVRERALLAGLDHAGVARLLDGGLDADGAPYLAMELVEGQPITDHADRQRLGLRDRIALFLQACDAVAHAHHHLVVHRDLKPAHVLVTEGAPRVPRVKLLDFGIAKLLEDDDDPGLTRTGAGPLTPAYAAPEQVLGRPVTTATDVYALGVVLYELLTGDRPYDVGGLPISEAARVVAQTPPTRPSQQPAAPDARRLRGDLDTVVLKALAKEPERRYASAEALADDLRRYLDGLPVEAQPDSVRYRAGKFARRHRTAVASAVLVALALVGGLGVALWQGRIAADERDRARAEAAKAEAVTTFLTSTLSAASPTAGEAVPPSERRVVDALGQAAAEAGRAFPGQPDVRATVLYTLGRTLLDLGLYVEAEAPLRTALALRDSLYGAAPHPATLEAVDALALLSLWRPDLPEGSRFHERALRLREQIYGPVSAEVARGLADLAEMRVEQDRADEGVALAERAVETAVAAEGEVSIAAGEATFALGSALLFAGRYAEADATLTRLAGLARDVLDPADARLAEILVNLGHARLLGGRPGAVEAFREAHAIRSARFDAGHPLLAEAQGALGLALVEAGRPVEAEPLLRAAQPTFLDGDPYWFNQHATAAALEATVAARGGRARPDRARAAVDSLAAGLGPDHALVRLARRHRQLAERRAAAG